ncbi:MAG: enoyl-CoA hydratase-related protein [Bacteroidales bacterium]
MYRYIKLEEHDQYALLWLARPQKRNAFDEHMIDELLLALETLRHRQDIRALVIRGEGRVFSAGADLDWMQSVMNYSFNENKLESKQLYRLFYAIYSFPFPVITLVHGASFGGANGIVAASDISLADVNTSFRFSEVQLGLVPATISPFVLRRIGEFNARELMLTGLPFDAEKAAQIGLVNFIGEQNQMEAYLDHIISAIKSSAAEAVKNTKWLIQKVAAETELDQLEDFTADMIASARISDEGQEGMKAFAQKRKPDWSNFN